MIKKSFYFFNKRNRSYLLKRKLNKIIKKQLLQKITISKRKNKKQKNVGEKKVDKDDKTNERKKQKKERSRKKKEKRRNNKDFQENRSLVDGIGKFEKSCLKLFRRSRSESVLYDLEIMRRNFVELSGNDDVKNINIESMMVKNELKEILEGTKELIKSKTEENTLGAKTILVDGVLLLSRQ